MSTLQNLVTFLDKSIYSPLLVADPCYVQVRNDYSDLLLFLAGTKDINIENATGDKREYLILLAKKEVLMRLAISVAPEYNVEAEFTKLLKSDRYTHYMGLIAQVDKDITASEESLSTIEAGQSLIDSRNGTKRNYELSLGQTIVPVFVTATDHVDIAFNIFDTSKGSFNYYKIVIGTDSFYDEFEDTPIDYSKVLKEVITVDMLKTKHRIKDLAPTTPYFILIVFAGRDGRKSYSYSTQSTL